MRFQCQQFAEARLGLYTFSLLENAVLLQGA